MNYLRNENCEAGALTKDDITEDWGEEMSLRDRNSV